jgi:predicted nuclease of restriction endonuclease-like RecB superfamily
MLTREHAIAEYEGGRVLPDRLDRRRHSAYAGYAERMLAIYRRGIGRTRRELHADVRQVFANESDCPTRRIEAFCKLLDDAGEFDADRCGEAAALRRQVFRLAAPSHPLVSSADRLFGKDERQVKAEIATALGMNWEEIDARLFGDIIECHRLHEFAGFADGTALLARYNVGQVQTALFDAVEMTIWARDDFKTILRYAKLARLLHTIRRDGDDGFVIRFDGPASLLRETRRYGAAMARFLPALIACHGWRMHALVRRRGGGWVNRLELSPADGLTSHLPPPEEFDSSIERAFAEKWGDAARDGWTLAREGEILHREQRVFVPDFVLRHTDGRRVLVEIVGFWTPEYLEAKLKTLRLFRGEPILIALAASRRHASFDAQLAAAGVPVIRFKSALSVKSVLDHLRCAE